ncbi:hypothetical protein NDU88_008343 [Pleurodeles waltl]|uniref:Uncharacterized protein n=1 Tax=Pleurodeles waltl TaxID=8319 RepID=A0AAV7RWL0_PLEWA|nr:hypothetical protein NDU88_008343 [Pleurodeles waltl]
MQLVVHCSQQTDVPATLKTELGTESRFSFPSDALSGRHDNTDAACLAGNPDIRIPEALKVDDGLRAVRVAAEGDAGVEKEKEKGGPEKSRRHPTTEELRESAVQDLAETGEVSEGRELCHVPGGTWLDQGSSWPAKVLFMGLPGVLETRGTEIWVSLGL